MTLEPTSNDPHHETPLPKLGASGVASHRSTNRGPWIIAMLLLGTFAFLPTLHAAPRDLSAFDQGVKKLAKRIRPQVVGIQVFERVPASGNGATSAAFEKSRMLSFSGIVWNKSGRVVSILRGGLPEPRAEGVVVGIEAILHDGQIVPCDFVAMDEYTGIMLLQMREVPKGLKGIKRPRTRDDQLDVGSMVLAIGQDTIHTGLVTNLRQRVELRDESFAFPRAIRTNIPAVPGNSGGLLCDTRGQLIGLLAFELEKRQGRSGQSGGGVHASGGAGSGDRGRGEVLAIPTDLLARIVGQLSKQGRFTRGAIGIQFRAVDFEQLCIGNSSRTAALVTWVDPHGPAAEAGLEVGHVIIGAAGGIFRSYEDLSRFTELVEYGAIGEPLRFTYFEYDRDKPALTDIRQGTAIIGARDAVTRRDFDGGIGDCSAQPERTRPIVPQR